MDFDPEDKLIPMHRGGNITLPAAFVEQFDITGEGRLYHELSADGKTITLRAANIEPLPPEPPLNQPPNAELLALSGVHRDDNHLHLILRLLEDRYYHWSGQLP